MARTINKFVLHHTAGSLNDTAESTSQAHKRRNWGSSRSPVYARPSSLGWYAQYHYFIDKDGKRTQFRKHDEIGWHAGVWSVNQKSIGVCLAGNFEHEVPTEAQLNELSKLMHELEDQYPKVDWLFHRDIKATACCGKWWTKDRLQKTYERMIKVPSNSGSSTWSTSPKTMTVVLELYKEYNSKEIYALGEDGMFHHIADEATFKFLFKNFNQQWNEVPDGFIPRDKISFPIAGQYN